MLWRAQTYAPLLSKHSYIPLQSTVMDTKKHSFTRCKAMLCRMFRLKILPLSTQICSKKSI